jgi:CubicO group peptidase (beta-lactamase class C family)
LLAELVDEKKLRWNEPVIEVYPSFKLGDAKTTRSILIKHLVCACTGMPRQDSEWAFATRKETPLHAMGILATIQPTSAFGEVFQYSNLLAAQAGYIGGSIAVPKKELGAAYDEAMQKKVLDPLGMKESTFDFTKAMRGNYAHPHDVDIDGKLVVGQMDFNYTVIPLRPSGGLWTNVHDLSQYVMMELAKGKLKNGQRLVSEQNLMQRQVPNVVISEDFYYGMGLMIDKRWGVTVIHHGGDLQGYHSDMMWFPEYNVGAVILTNSENGRPLRDAFLRKFAELLFDGKPEAEAEVKAAVAHMDDKRIKERARLQVPPDPAVTSKLAARYDNKSLGKLRISRIGKDVIFSAGSWSSKVASRKNDDGTTSFVTISPNLQGFEFVVGERNQKPTLIIREAQHEYEFVEY